MKELGHWPESNYKIANKIVWQTTNRLRVKRSQSTSLRMLKAIFSVIKYTFFQDGENTLKIFKIQKNNDLDTHEKIQFGKIDAFAAIEVSTIKIAVKIGKVYRGDKIRPELLYLLAWNQILWLTKASQPAFKV